MEAAAVPFRLSLEKTGLWEGFAQRAHKCRLLVLFLKASLTSSPRVTTQGTEEQSVQPESPQVGLNPGGNGKFIRKENVEGCQTLGWVSGCT